MKIKAGTIARTIVLAIALLNTMLVIFGKDPFHIEEESIYQICTAAAAIGSAWWAWWKNNSFSKSAIEADEVKDEIKAESQFIGVYDSDRRDEDDVVE